MWSYCVCITLLLFKQPILKLSFAFDLPLWLNRQRITLIVFSLIFNNTQIYTIGFSKCNTFNFCMQQYTMYICFFRIKHKFPYCRVFYKMCTIGFASLFVICSNFVLHGVWLTSHESNTTTFNLQIRNDFIEIRGWLPRH